MPKQIDELEAELAEAAKKILDSETASQELTARAEKAEALVKLTADERKLYDGFDSADQDKFLKLDGKMRAKAVSKAADDDESEGNDE